MLRRATVWCAIAVAVRALLSPGLAGGLPVAPPAKVTRTTALPASVVALAMVLGFALAGAVVVGKQPAQSREASDKQLDQQTVAQSFGSSDPAAPPDQHEPALLLHSLLDHCPDRVCFKDRTSRFVAFSRSFREQWAVAPACDLKGKTDFDFFPADQARQTQAEEQEIIRTGLPLSSRLEMETHADGRVTWTLTSKFPWRDSSGQIIGTFGIARDVTALQETEAQLAKTNQRLAYTSRLAGTAEVATDVLHNVGNVLNSVNVSCSLVMDRVQASSLDNLARIPALLREQAGRLDDFLIADPRGKQIPQYLTTVAADFAAERQFLLTELARLRQHIDHIKQVVAMQQNYAKVSGVSELVAVEQLVADALQINASALDRHAVTLRKECEPVPAIVVDKHKVLQILVNLINNAKYAVSPDQAAERCITLRVAPDGNEHVLIQVQDNGIGIPPENLTRIFSHGFTTRPDGHGFGLHSGTLAARELGGVLSVQSDGPGHGATFTLRLPRKPPTASPT